MGHPGLSKRSCVRSCARTRTVHQGGIWLVKLVLEIALAVVLHPVALVLSWINIAGRTDLSTLQKILWAVVCFVWGIGPILYILFGGGTLW